MRIAVLSDTIYPTPWAWGHGLGRAVFNVCTELIARGHTVSLYGLLGSRLPGGNVYTTPDNTPNGEALLMADITARQAEYDVALDAGHTHTLAHAQPLPTIAWFQDRASAKAHNAVFVSKDQRSYVDLPGIVVRNGVRIDEFTLYDQRVSRHMIFLGSEIWHKGLKDAERIAEIAGRKLRAYGSGCPDGMIKDRDKVQALQYACVCLCPYSIDAGPLVPLEAMACGTPVVGYDKGALPEYVQPPGGYLGDTKYGLAALIDLAESLKPSDVRSWVIDNRFTAARQGKEMEEACIRLLDGDRW